MTYEIVAFGPHPDDVELFAGGLIAKMAAMGRRVAIVDLTRGELASGGSVEERAREAEQAARILGVQHRENLALPDGGIALEDAQQEKVIEALRRLKPELVVAPFARERHPDHEAASALVRRAVFVAGLKKYASKGAPHRARATLWYPMRQLAEASFVVDVSDVHETKMSAIRAHASQVGGPGLVGSPLSLSSLQARDAFYGAHIGAAYGEAFVVDEMIAVPDPLEHFRKSAGPALFFPSRGGR